MKKLLLTAVMISVLSVSVVCFSPPVSAGLEWGFVQYWVNGTTDPLNDEALTDAMDEPTEPAWTPTPVGDGDFIGWRNNQGEMYIFSDYLPVEGWIRVDVDADNVMEYVYRLYAVFTYDLGVADIDEPTDSTPTGITAILSGFDLNDGFGKMLVCAGILLILTIAMVFFKVSGLTICIADMLGTTVFLFLGWLAVWETIILFSIFAVGLAISLPKGATTNE